MNGAVGWRVGRHLGRACLEKTSLAQTSLAKCCPLPALEETPLLVSSSKGRGPLLSI